MMKKFNFCILIVAFTMCAFSIAYAAETYLYDDFSSEVVSKKPTGVIIKETGGEVVVANLNASKKETNMICLKDTAQNGELGVMIMKQFPNLDEKCAVEIKFKMESKMGKVEFVIGEGSTTAYRLVIGSDGSVQSSNGTSFNTYQKTKIALSNWNTLRVVLDNNGNIINARVNNEILQGLGFCSDYSGKGINYIIANTSMGTPELYIDYIKIETGNDLNADVVPPKAPEVDDPTPHPVKGQINVNYNGEFMYFTDKPVMKNDRVLLPLRSIFEMLEMEVTWNSETNTAISKNEKYEIEITQNQLEAKVNGTVKSLDVPATIIKDTMYIPLRFVSENIGAEVLWDEATSTVNIKSGGGNIQ